ncbi:MAG: hypothetical protein ACXVX3_16335 [Blastococcus sp.]
MIARQPHVFGRRTPGRGAPPPGVVRADTIPRAPLLSAGAEDEPTILGFPAEAPDDENADDDAPGDDAPGDDEPGDEGTDQELWPTLVMVRPAEEPHSPARLVVLRRAETVGGLCLVLAGAVAAVSLWLPWTRGAGGTGLLLFRQGIEALGPGVGVLARSSLWPPLAVVLAGGLLYLLGVPLFFPARGHRFVGVLALAVALAATAGVLALFADAGWTIASFRYGMCFVVAVPVLGLCGALKAMLTFPRVTTQPR